MSDQIAVIDQGRIGQIGSPQDIYFRPANPFVARFVGATNLLAGRLVGTANGRGDVEVLGERKIKCLVPAGIADASSVSVSIRPESIRLVPRGGGPARPATTASPARSAASRSSAPRRRVDVVSDGVNLQVTTAADMPLPADGEVAPVRAGADCRFARQGVVEMASAISDQRSGSQAQGEEKWPRNTKRSWSRRATASPG